MSGCHNCWPHYMKRVCDTTQHSSQSWEIGLVYHTLVTPLQLLQPSTQLLLRLYTHTHTAMTSLLTCPTRARARTHTHHTPGPAVTFPPYASSRANTRYSPVGEQRAHPPSSTTDSSRRTVGQDTFPDSCRTGTPLRKRSGSHSILHAHTHLILEFHLLSSTQLLMDT